MRALNINNFLYVYLGLGFTLIIESLYLLTVDLLSVLFIGRYKVINAKWENFWGFTIKSDCNFLISNIHTYSEFFYINLYVKITIINNI